MDSNTRISDPTGYTAGRARIPDGATPDWDAIMAGDMSLTVWLTEYWTRRVDAELDAIHTDVYDLADRVHYLGVMTLATLLAVVVGLIGVLVAMLI